MDERIIGGILWALCGIVAYGIIKGWHKCYYDWLIDLGIGYTRKDEIFFGMFALMGILGLFAAFLFLRQQKRRGRYFPLTFCYRMPNYLRL